MKNLNKTCLLCNETFHFQSGRFFLHLKEFHNLSNEQYCVITKYNGCQPKCKCGYCDDNAIFLSRKNDFQTINKKHREYSWLKEQYIKKNGIPKCKNENCNSLTEFHRGLPLLYCSPKCFPNRWNQSKIKYTLHNKYSIDNPMDNQEFKNKCIESIKEQWKINKKSIVSKIKKTKKERYNDENYINVPKMKLSNLKKYGVEHYSKTQSFKDNSKQRMINKNPMKNPAVVDKMVNTYINNINSGKTRLYKTFNYKDTKLRYQSNYELKFLELCESNNWLSNIANGKCFKYLPGDKQFGKRYMSDFLYDNKIIIEIKSTYILNKQGGMDKLNAKIRAVTSLGFDFILILDNNFSDLIEKINNPN